MKLQPALIFCEHMVLQQNKNIPIWGRSASEDTITVSLANQTKKVYTQDGEWKVEFEPLQATIKTSMTIFSKKTGEKIEFNDIAVGEVWLAGGQSNMEFLLKYDFNLTDMLNKKGDKDLRFFNYPQTPFLGYLEKENCGDFGFWRTYEDEEDCKMFSAVGAYMGLILREKLNVPVGIVGCNWGGTPALAWADINAIKYNTKLKTALDWHEDALDKLNWNSYISSSEEKIPEQTPEQKAFFEKFMMGEDMSEFFKNGPPPLDPNVYAPYAPGYRSCGRPGGLYEMMLSKVAPYSIRGVIWYQGEDDDAKDWVDFYDESMVTMINSWRKLWKYDFPFLQVELAPFKGLGVTAAKRYPELRHKQALAASRLKDVYDICILDVGEEYNIHPRKKQKVGKRLANVALKYVYGFSDTKADFPIVSKVNKKDNIIEISFDNSYEGLSINNDVKKYLIITNNDSSLDYEVRVDNDKLLLELKKETKGLIKIEFCESNYCLCPLYNSEGNPAFGFTIEI